MKNKTKNKTNKDYHDRKPNLETESLRMWKLEDDEKPQERGETDFDLELSDGTKFTACGFNIAYNDKKEIVFAYKFKNEEKLILYYVPENISDEEKEKADFMIEVFKQNPIGYEVQSMKDIIKNIENEKHLIGKIGENENGTKNN